MKGFRSPIPWLRGLVRSIIRPRPRIALWKWAEQNVVVPESAGSPAPGPLRTSRSPVLRGVYDLAGQDTTRHLTFCASARVGKTMFCLVVVLYWLAEMVGNVAWLDPTQASARRFVRSELDAFLRLCVAVRKLAVTGAKYWSTFWRTFRGGKNMRIVGSGAEGDQHGFSAELIVANERDRLMGGTGEDSDSVDKMASRARLYPYTSLIIENSTPGIGGEFSPTWKSFLRGSQHHCYLPCPHCSRRASYAGKARVIDETQPMQVGWSPLSREEGLAGWQRLTFASEKKTVPFDAQLRPLLGPNGRVLPRDKWREEVTGQIRYDQFAIYEEQPSARDETRMEPMLVGYDIPAMKDGTTYRCACCGQDISRGDFDWMLNRYRWCAHNPDAPHDRISIHLWAAYSPFEQWWSLAKEFVEAGGNLSALVKICNQSWGLPYIRAAGRVRSEDLDRVIRRSPDYSKGTLPRKPLVLAAGVDKQEDRLYYVIRAFGILGAHEHPEMPTWSALVDWGECFSWDELLERTGVKPRSDGTYRRFPFKDKDGTTEEFAIIGGLVDSSNGREADLIYSFCAANRIFEPYKGATSLNTNAAPIKMSKAFGDSLRLWLCLSDFWAENLYHDCIQNGVEFAQPVHWWLPSNIDAQYRNQLCDEHRDPDKGWVSRTGNNHLGDCEKELRPFAMSLEENWFQPERKKRRAA